MWLIYLGASYIRRCLASTFLTGVYHQQRVPGGLIACIGLREQEGNELAVLYLTSAAFGRHSAPHSWMPPTGISGSLAAVQNAWRTPAEAMVPIQLSLSLMPANQVANTADFGCILSPAATAATAQGALTIHELQQQPVQPVAPTAAAGCVSADGEDHTQVHDQPAGGVSTLAALAHGRRPTAQAQPGGHDDHDHQTNRQPIVNMQLRDAPAQATSPPSLAQQGSVKPQPRR